MNNNKFQVILLFVCGLAVVIAVMIFSGFIKIKSSSSKTEITGSLTIWGTLPSAPINNVLTQMNQSNKLLTASYVQKDPNTFIADMTEAISNDSSPDLVMIPQSLLLSLKKRIAPIQYTQYPESTFKTTYLEGGEIFLGQEGIYALPLTIDPLVMYYNRDIFANAGVVNPPVYWDEFNSLIDDIIKKSPTGNINQSLIALGTYNNIAHAKEIISSLLIQAGNPIVTLSDGKYYSVLSSVTDKKTGLNTASTVMSFFTNFSNPTNDSYSWNQSLPNSRNMFLSGDLAVYLGFSSELFDLRKRNPNLNFAPAPLPQIRGTVRPFVYGDITGIAIINKTNNFPASTAMLFQLASQTNALGIAQVLQLPSARRDGVNSDTKGTGYTKIFNIEAINAHAWYDPNPNTTDNLFRSMIGNIISGRLDVSTAINQTSQSLGTLLQ